MTITGYNVLELCLKYPEIVDLLNKKEEEISELEKENEKLKIDIMGQSEEIEILSDENERLKQIREEQTETILKQKRKMQELEVEKKMLKITISRNEAYINQIRTNGKWSNSGDVDD